MKQNLSKAMKRYNHLLGEIDGTYHEIALKLGLSDSALAILYTIYDSGSCCLLQDICRRSGLRKQTVNSALRKLEAEEILYLKPVSPKAKYVCLTESGKRLAEQTAGRVIEIENEIFSSWAQEDVQRYLELTEDFLSALRDKARQLYTQEHTHLPNDLLPHPR